MPSRRSCASFVLLALLTSCGTDNQPTAPRDSFAVPFSAGELSGSTLGALGAPVTTSGPGALITGIPGQFTSLSYRGPGGATISPYIYFAMGQPATGASANIWRIGINGAGIQRLTSDTQQKLYPSISPDGRQVVFFQTIAELGHAPLQDIIRIQSDGSGRSKIGTSIDSRDPVAWTPRADSFYFYQNDPFSVGIWRQANSMVTAELLTDQAEGPPSLGVLGGMPTMMFGFRGRLMQMNLLTRDTTVFFANPAAALSQPKLSPDGRRLLFFQQDSGVVTGAPYQLRVANTASPATSKLLATISLDGLTGIPSATWALDGRHLIATLQPGPNLFAQLYELDADATGNATGVPRRLITTLAGTLFPGVSVGPAASAQNRLLIGPGAPLGESASGIVFGQREGGVLASVVAFGGASPDSVELTAETGLNSNAPVLSVSLRADRLTSLAFTNDPAGPVTQVTDSSSSATGALITFDAATGAVALVLPFTLTRGDETPTVRDEGTSRVFHGHFLAVIGADGVARPGVAGEVVFDHTSGTIHTR